MSTVNVDAQLDRFFEKSKHILSQDLKDILDQEGMPKVTDRFSRLSLGDIFKVLNKLNVTFDSVIQGNVDFEIMHAQVRGVDRLPVRYTERAVFSSRFTSIYMMNFIRSRFGEESAQVIRQHFQLCPSHFEDITEFNNMLLPQDLCMYVNKFYGADMLETMGHSSLKVMASTGLGDRLRTLPTIRDMIEYFITEVISSNVERNYSWKLQKIEENSFVVEGAPKEEVVEMLGRSSLVSPAFENLRAGFASAIPQLYKNYRTNVIKLKSLSQGNDCDLLRIEFFPWGSLQALH